MGRFSNLGFVFYIKNNKSRKIKKRRIYIKYLNKKVEIRRTIKNMCGIKKIEFENLLNETKT